jgi:signal transduction histidine kinase/CheY-like chemotaxis protein
MTEPALPDHAPPRRRSHVAVEGRYQSVDGPAEAASYTERHALDRRVRDAALRSAARQLKFVGALWFALLPLVALAFGGWPSAFGLAWGVANAVVAATMVWFAHKPQWATPARLAALGTVAAVAAALPAWWAPAELRGLPAMLASAFGILGAAMLPSGPAAAVVLALLPLAASGAVAGWASAWSLAGLVASAATAAFAWHAHGAWRQARVALLQQIERARGVERELAESRRTDEEKSRFLAIASHDLRQPVHALGLFAATLHKRLQRSPDEPLARNLMQAIDGLERSFNAMLDISRLDGGALVPRLQTFPLRDMFRRLQMQYAGQAEFAGLGLRFSPGGKSVTSDPQLLERIVGNLVQNAIKYTTRGGIVVVARSTADAVNIEIWDTGCGIAAGELPRIFDEFYQVGRAERDRSRGLGMGLAIVKRLARLLGHRLEVHSTPGRGTMFRVGVAIGGLPGIQEDLAPADTLPMTVQTPRMVLVVDDEEAIREGLRALLQEWGYHAMTAADGQQAERVVASLEGHVDLVLSDLHLGDGPDGAEVIENIRRLCGRDVPAVLVTGETSRDEVRRVAAGGDPVLFKPVQPRRLFEVLQSVLG